MARVNRKIIWELGNYYWQKNRVLFSIAKVFKHLTELLHSMREIIIEKRNSFQNLLTTVFDICPKYFLLEKRKGKLSMKDILMANIVNEC